MPSHRVLDVVRGITEIFREQQGLRQSRDRARMKHLFLREGWTPEKFLDELLSRLAFSLDPAVDEIIPSGVLRDHVGVHHQRQPGLFHVGASVLRGRVTGEQLEAAANSADRLGNGELRTTIAQNLLFVNIPEQNVGPLVKELAAIDLKVDGSAFWRGTITCTGTEFCKLAITETKDFARWLVDEMETRIPAFDQQLKLHVTGCPNSCGQHWVADVGIEGKRIKQNGTLVEAYYFCVGGGVGTHSAIARAVGYRCLATEVPEALERLLNNYLLERAAEEDLQSFFRARTNDQLRTVLAGTAIAPVPRDQPVGAVPQGVGD